MTPRLFALAFDHRNSLRRDFLGLTGPPRPDQVALARDLKAIVLDGLLTAVDEGLAGGEPAILVDEEYGAAVIERAKAHGVAVVVPVEVSGQAELRFEHGDDGFGTAIERVDPTFVKVLVRYDPDADNSPQHQRLALLQRWLDAHPRPWLLEVLTPRPDLAIRAVEQLVDAGLRPAYWKLEGMPSTGEFEKLAMAANAPCLVLGRGADNDAVRRWLTDAARAEGYAGFAVGRTLWWNPLRAFVDGRSPRAAAVEAVATNYRNLVDTYLAAAN